MRILTACTLPRQEGLLAQVIVDATRAIELDPKFAKAYSNLARAYAKLGKTGDASKDFIRAIELDPNLRRSL